MRCILNVKLTKLAKKWRIIGLITAAVIISVVMGELAGWPFLATPLENKLSALMARKVSFDVSNKAQSTKVSTDASQLSDKQSTKTQAFHISFISGLTLKTAKLLVAAPSWSSKPHFINADNVLLKLRYIDVWRAYRGQPLSIKSFQASKFDGYIERKADGRASWQFSNKPSDPKKPLRIPTFDQLLLTDGFLHIDDVPLKSNIEAKVSLINSLEINSAEKVDSNAIKKSTLTASATGRYQSLPLKVDLVSTGKLPTSIDPSASEKAPVAMTINATVGRAILWFEGETENIMRPNNFEGHFKLKGPSLAAVGDLIKVTLPTTAVFSTNGSIEKQGSIWATNINQMNIGGSALNGRFTYDKSLATPLLTGQLAGKLVITDLGPAFGADTRDKKSNKVLPTRPFDLASLRKMDADIKIDMQYLDLKTPFLEPLKPLRASLRLNDAILTLKKINALTADGRLTGNMSLDGRSAKALLDANLDWNGVRLERWVKQKRASGLPPYVSGKLNGKAILKGQGKSTAELLASLDGTFRTELVNGAVSHLAIEVAGLDVAQSIGVLFKGDEALSVQCGVVDLQAKNGVFTPRVMVVDTTDTTVWVDGSLSLAAESLNLRAMALPKDFSPLTIRVPLNVTGSFANPVVSLDKKPVGLKLATSVLLAIVNPLAAVIPLLDSGDNKEAKNRVASCANLMRKNKPAPTSARQLEK